jgi:GNAT superfamily N-acetyltransferase
MVINIRKGTPNDIPAVLDLIRELAAYEKAPHEVTVTASQMQAWGFGEEKLFDFFVAEYEGVVIGLALYYFKYSTWKGKCLFLEDIIVNEGFRRHGAGSLLFEAVRAVANELKVGRMEWQVLEWNESAIQFYKKWATVFDNEWINCKIVQP